MSIWTVISVILAVLAVSVLCLILAIVKRNKKLILFSLVFLAAVLVYVILLYSAITSFSSGPQIPR
jgi:hypothetical protein